MEKFIEIICVGNELLIGKTVNTNAYWLAKKITSLGLVVKRITSIEDSLEAISLSVRETLKRGPSFVLMTGGLGPTFDDMTLLGVATGLGRELETNKIAQDMIEKKYRGYTSEGKINNFKMTPYRAKMANLPKDAKPLVNPVGTAPGVLVKQERTTFVILPGVPQEMKAIFNESISSLLHAMAGNVVFYEASLEVKEMPESELAPIIDKVMHDNPYVYIKSHPQASESFPYLELHLSTSSADSKLVRNRISRAILQVSELIQEEGGIVKPMKV